jgi:hypothetical protein
MRTVFVLPFGADTGGVNHQIVSAFRREPGWLVRAMISGTNYIHYPPDLPFDYSLLGEWWRAADVIHLSHEFFRLRKVERLRLPSRPKVMHYHGTGYRERAEDLIRHQRAHKAIGLVASLDLWLLNPDETEWLPCPYDLAALQKWSCSRVGSVRRPGMVKVAHAPTARKIKSTEPFLQAVRQLQLEGYDLELELIEKASWKECLQRKATADIYFDQTILGYGNNAIEAWGMGIPVIAGASEKTLAEMRRRFSNELPFYQATEATIYDALKALVQSPDLRAEYSERGLFHVQKFHDQRVVVEQLKDVYQRALDGKH